MTWLTTWPDEHRHPQYEAHRTEAKAQKHAEELVKSGRAVVATYFWSEDEEKSA